MRRRATFRWRVPGHRLEGDHPLLDLDASYYARQALHSHKSHSHAASTTTTSSASGSFHAMRDVLVPVTVEIPSATLLTELNAKSAVTVKAAIERSLVSDWDLLSEDLQRFDADAKSGQLQSRNARVVCVEDLFSYTFAWRRKETSSVRALIVKTPMSGAGWGGNDLPPLTACTASSYELCIVLAPPAAPPVEELIQRGDSRSSRKRRKLQRSEAADASESRVDSEAADVPT